MSLDGGAGSRVPPDAWGWPPREVDMAVSFKRSPRPGACSSPCRHAHTSSPWERRTWPSLGGFMSTGSAGSRSWRSQATSFSCRSATGCCSRCGTRAGHWSAISTACPEPPGNRTGPDCTRAQCRQRCRNCRRAGRRGGGRRHRAEEGSPRRGRLRARLPRRPGRFPPARAGAHTLGMSALSWRGVLARTITSPADQYGRAGTPARSRGVL
jgi:hypothetical protein